MTEEQYQKLKAKIDKEWGLRCKLATLAGHIKCNPKNVRSLMDTEYDLNISELYLQVLFRKPERADEALKAIQEFYHE